MWLFDSNKIVWWKKLIEKDLSYNFHIWKNACHRVFIQFSVRMEMYVWQEVSHIWKLYDKKFWSTRAACPLSCIFSTKSIIIFTPLKLVQFIFCFSFQNDLLLHYDTKIEANNWGIYNFFGFHFKPPMIFHKKFLKNFQKIVCLLFLKFQD